MRKKQALLTCKLSKPRTEELNAKLPILNEVSEEPCKRCGTCCRFVLLSHPPSRLRNDYNRWTDSFPTHESARYGGRLEEVHLLCPMLLGNCLGKWKNPRTHELRYVYSCNMLGEETLEDGHVVARCKIRDIRPWMCRGYPFYTRAVQAFMTATGDKDSPGYIRGCGYNQDPKEGFPIQGFRKLIPLTEEER